jgi:pyruvate dehydrogenase E1 component alpha subunit
VEPTVALRSGERDYPLGRLVDPPQESAERVPLLRVLGENGTLVSDPPDLAADDLRSMYEWMLRTRVFDTRMLSLQRQGRIAFFVPSFGEEAGQIGTAWALTPEDWIFPAYREQGIALYRGYPLEALLCQMFGNSEDYLKGRQMPDHFGCPRIRFAVASSPVGTQIPHAVGAAWSSRLRREDSVSVCYFGDGATSTGDFHAGLNFAGVQQLPVVFFCKNNGWAISLPREKQTKAEFLVDKAIGYGMPGILADGNDILAVYRAAHEAVERARSGGGPTLVELVTQRMGPHSTSDDPSRYRSPDLLEPWKKKDPLIRYRQYLEGRGLWDDADEKRAWEEFDARITEALAWAEAQPPPAPESIFEDVFAEMPWHLAEQRDEVLGK